MDLLKQTKQLCSAYGIKPIRSRGQNFLIKEEIYDKIVAASDLIKDDIVLEVGPGLGFLTAKLAKIAKRVVAVELDDKLAEILTIGLKAQKVNNVEVVNRNILDFGFLILDLNLKSAFQNLKYKIVANLPYNITSVFLRKFLSADEKPSMMVLMLQKEVAERICASAGDMSLLAVSVQFYADAGIISYVPKENFWPRPEVDSAIVKLVARSKKYEVEEKKLFQLVKIGFSARRKMLKNNLAAGFRISNMEAENRIINAGFSQNCRAQELAVEDWLKLLPYFIEKT
jgi:16S rRNA (adenine1518-N6/adenine1519-N6)-dimethyltransferase